MKTIWLTLMLAAFVARADGPKRPYTVNRDAPALLRFLPAGGGQSHVVGSAFCDLFSSELTGNYFCLNGDASQRSAAGMTLSPVGSPTSYVAPVCPNGPNCASVTSQRLDGVGQSFETADVTSPASDASVWWYGALTNFAATRSLVSKDSQEANNRSLSLTVNTSGQPVCTAWKTDAASTAVTGTAMTVRAHHLVVCTYDWVTDGTSEVRLYVDGVASGTPSTTAVGPLQAAASTYWGVGERENTGGRQWLLGLTRGAGLTESELSAAVIQQMANAALGKLSSSFGEPVTIVHSSAVSCYDESGQFVTQLPPNRPCVSKTALRGQAAVTNVALQCESYDTTWNKTGLVVNSDVLVAPDGSKTADRLRKDDATTNRSVNQQISASTAGEKWSCTVWGSGDVYNSFDFGIYNQSASAWSPQTGAILGAGPGAISGTGLQTVTGLANDGGWTRACTTTDVITDGGSRALYIYPIAEGSTDRDGGVFFWRSVCANVAYCPDDCGPTAGTSVTCAISYATMAKPVGLSETEGCVCADVTPNWTGVPPVQNPGAVLWGNAAGTARFMFVSTAGANLYASNGVQQPAVATTFARGSAKRYCTRWSAARGKIRTEDVAAGASNEVSSFTAFGTFDSTFGYAATAAGSNSAIVSIGNVQWGASWESCR